MYVITPKKVFRENKTNLDFMKRKMKEYDELKSEIEKDNENK